MITLYKNTNVGTGYGWNTEPIMTIKEAKKCVITENDQGTFELEATWPIISEETKELNCGRVLGVSGIPRVASGLYSGLDQNQGFRIQTVDRNRAAGTVTVYATALFYDFKFQYIAADSLMKKAVTGEIGSVQNPDGSWTIPGEGEEVYDVAGSIVTRYNATHATARLVAPLRINFDPFGVFGWKGSGSSPSGPKSIFDWVMTYKNIIDKNGWFKPYIAFNNFEVFISKYFPSPIHTIKLQNNNIVRQIDDLTNITPFVRAWWAPSGNYTEKHSSMTTVVSPNHYYKEKAFDHTKDFSTSSPPTTTQLGNLLTLDLQNSLLSSQVEKTVVLRDTNADYRPGRPHELILTEKESLGTVYMTGYKYDCIANKFLEQTFSFAGTIYSV